MSKTPNLVNLLISFQALRLSFQRRTLRFYTVTVVLFDLAIDIGNLRRVQLSFSFPSTVDVSTHPVRLVQSATMIRCTVSSSRLVFSCSLFVVGLHLHLSTSIFSCVSRPSFQLSLSTDLCIFPITRSLIW